MRLISIKVIQLRLQLINLKSSISKSFITYIHGKQQTSQFISETRVGTGQLITQKQLFYHKCNRIPFHSYKGERAFLNVGNLHRKSFTLNPKEFPGDFAPGDHRRARINVLQNFAGPFERRVSGVLKRQC